MSIAMSLSKVASAYGVNNVRMPSQYQRITRAEEKKDMVALSSQAKDFQAVMRELSKISDVREDKVSDIQNRIQSGNYNVSSLDIASKILEKA